MSAALVIPDGPAPRGFTPVRTRLIRRVVFAWYGEECACCGATERLTIDHIAGDGRAQRIAALGSNTGGNVYYLWLIRHGFPPGHQTLCSPCNRSKYTHQRCRLPHGIPARRCSRCGKLTPLTDFPPGKRRCPPCRASDATRWAK